MVDNFVSHFNMNILMVDVDNSNIHINMKNLVIYIYNVYIYIYIEEPTKDLPIVLNNICHDTIFLRNPSFQP